GRVRGDVLRVGRPPGRPQRGAAARRAPRRGRAGRRLRPERRRLGAALARRLRRDDRARRRTARARLRAGGRVKVGIVVPFSWSYWGGVVEHSEHQAAALRRRGHDVKVLMGNDPPGKFTRFLHPRSGRHGPLPEGIVPVGRSVVVPANGSLPNIILSPSTVGRIRRILDEEQFDVVHLHEPMTPAICVATLAIAQCPVVVTHHAHGNLGWMRYGLHFWGFLMDRVDVRIAVSPMAAESAARWLPGDYRVIPNGVFAPPEADPADRDHAIVFIGRHDPRKGLPTLLRAWPEI